MAPTITTAWMMGCVCGFLVGVMVAGRRRSFSRENTNAPQGPPPLKLRRSGLMRDAYGRPIGYIPRPQGGTPNPPPSDP